MGGAQGAAQQFLKVFTNIDQFRYRGIGNRTPPEEQRNIAPMSYQENLERAAEVAEAALAHMTSNDIPATPHNFMVWYEFYSGGNAPLKKTLREMIDNDREFDRHANEEIYNSFFARDDDLAQGVALQQRIGAIAQQVLGVLEATGKDTEHYGETLQSFSGNLEGASDADDIRKLVSEVIEETRGVTAQIDRLQSKVSSSTDEINQLKDELEDARRDAMTDGLTGVANRKCFDETLKLSTQAAIETGEPLSLMLADLDHFKMFNDSHGHQIGDQALKIVGMTLRRSVKGQDTAARYGGEEFAVILPNTDLAGAVAVAESIRNAIASKKLVRKNSNVDYGTITISVGVTTYVPGESIADFIERADRTMYDAKKFGRNRVMAVDGDSAPVATSA